MFVSFLLRSLARTGNLSPFIGVVVQGMDKKNKPVIPKNGKLIVGHHQSRKSHEQVIKCSKHATLGAHCFRVIAIPSD